MNRLLCFDTSTERLAIAVSVDGRTFTYEGEGGAQASTQLLPQAFALLQRAGIGLKDVDAIAYGRGPGAFTGLRTACSVAQGLALGANKPVIGVDSLMLVAESTRAGFDAASAAPVWVAMDARMDEIYAAAYAPLPQAGAWRVLTAPALYGLDAFHAMWASDGGAGCAVVGSALAAFGDRLCLPGAVPVAADARPDARAQALASLARVLWCEGAGGDAASALPLYVRNQVAQTTAERAAVKAAAARAAAARDSL